MCEKWNRKNSDYFKTNYLQRKLDAATGGDQSKTGFHDEGNRGNNAFFYKETIITHLWAATPSVYSNSQRQPASLPAETALESS
jgi:hypothetical protein